jgi:hypothetical protein
MIFWRLLQVPIKIYVIEKVLTSVQVDVFIICASDYVVALLSFRLSDEVGLMLTFILALLVKVNEVFGGAAVGHRPRVLMQGRKKTDSY